MSVLKLTLSKRVFWTCQNVTNLPQAVHPHNAIAVVGSLDYFTSGPDAALYTALQAGNFPSNTVLAGGGASSGSAYILGKDNSGTVVQAGFRVLRAVHRLVYSAKMLYGANRRLDLLGNGVFDSDAAGGFASVPEFAIEPSMATISNNFSTPNFQITLESLAALYNNGELVSTDNTAKRTRYLTTQAGNASVTMVELRGPNNTLPAIKCLSRGVFFKSNPLYTAGLVTDWNLIANSAVQSSATHITEWTIVVDDAFLTSAGNSGFPVYAIFPLSTMEGEIDYYGFGSGGNYSFSPTVQPMVGTSFLNACININDALQDPQGLFTSYGNAPADILINNALTGAAIAPAVDVLQIARCGVRQNSGGDFDALDVIG